MNEKKIYKAEVEFGDPHNDQVAAQAHDDLDWHIGSARDTLAQGKGDVVAPMAVIATAFINHADMYSRERLASLLAVALVELAKGESHA